MEQQDVAQLREEYSQGKISATQITNLANEHLQNNDSQKAYPYILILAESDDVSEHTLLTAGLIALSLGKREEAAGYFSRIVENNGSHFDANYNLALLDLEQGDIDSAADRLSRLIQLNPGNATLHSDMAVIQVNKQDMQSAFSYWEKALTLDPNLSLARDNAMELCLEKKMVEEGKRLLLLNARATGVSSRSVREIEGWANRLHQIVVAHDECRPIYEQAVEPEQPIKGQKIAVFASMDTFVKDIVKHLSADNEIKTFNGGNVERMQQLLDWADLAWFEWCDSFIIEATRLPKTCRMVCRLHSYEAFTDMPAAVDWQKIDLLIFVNESVRDIVTKKMTLPCETLIIHNAVDTSRFKLPTAKRYGKKIASVGYINYKKNPALLLYCFKKIHEYDPEYTLHIAGQHQDPRIQLYFEHFLQENPLPVRFDGWVDNMEAWYEDKDFVISTSLFESFHYSIAEGMARGLMPLIHNWRGAANIYPKEYLFNDVDECLELLKRLEKADRVALARDNHEFIADRYNLKDKLDTVSASLARLVEAETIDA